MGKRVYQASNGQIYETKAAAMAEEQLHELKVAFEALGVDISTPVSRADADRLIAALRPYATRKTFTRKSTNGRAKGKGSTAEAVA